MFFIMAYDDPAKPGARMEVRPRHLPLLKAACESGLIRFAGPILEEGGTGMLGSLIVIDLKTREEVQRWLETEPFYTEGVWAKDRITILPCGIAAQPYLPLPGSTAPIPA
ncbi:YciI family protein [Acetobacteraceae bacterium H6797]|nr:YciI family protein [Acetobacteraceae bacterium H6797]